MSTATVEPGTLTEEELVQRFREELGDDADIPCDRAEFGDCSKRPAMYGVILAGHSERCPNPRRRNYCERCFLWARRTGVHCLGCDTYGVPLERYWRL